MREGEAAVDLRLLGILRGEEGVELFLRIDDAGVRVAESDGAGEKVFLDRFEQSGALA